LIKRYFFVQNIVVTFYNIFKLGFNNHNCPKINIFNSHGKKIFLSFPCNVVCKNIVWELGLSENHPVSISSKIEDLLFCPFPNTLWHTNNVIYWFSVKKLVNMARLFTKLKKCCHINSYSLQWARWHHL